MKGIKNCGESEKRTAAVKQQYSNKKGYASGGRVYTAGAESGEGRKQKIAEYGANAKKK